MFRAVQILVLITAGHSGLVLAQEQRRPPDLAPPPLKTISRVERTQLDEADGPKDRVKLALTLAETHLANAETRSSQSDFPGASAEIGRYWAMIEDVFGFMKTLKPDATKTRDMYKRVELTLRGHGPRLVAMRRGTPAEYSVWIKEIEEFARNGRTEALISFYGHTVFRDANTNSVTRPEGVPPQKASNATEVKKP
jgi:hypothetical protein